jgi:hypothetical protein
VGRACALACAGAALPLTLLAGAQGPRPARAATPTKRVVIVKRPVVKRVVVREIMTVPAAAAHPSPPITVHAAARTPARRHAVVDKTTRRAARRPAAKTTPAATTTPAPTTAPAATTTAPPAPPAPTAATETGAQPAG